MGSAAKNMRHPRHAEEEMKPASVGDSKARFYEPTCCRALLYDMIDTFHQLITTASDQPSHVVDIGRFAPTADQHSHALSLPVSR